MHGGHSALTSHALALSLHLPAIKVCLQGHMLPRGWGIMNMAKTGLQELEGGEQLMSRALSWSHSEHNTAVVTKPSSIRAHFFKQHCIGNYIAL